MRDEEREEIRERADMLSIVGERVALKKRGRQYVGPCPFHQEKTGSFSVDPDKKLFQCFGCGAKGDIFSFVQQAEGVDFMEAARILAEKTGVELLSEANGSRQSLVIRDALSFFSYILEKAEDGEMARTAKGVKSLSPFKDNDIGYAPANNKSVGRYLKKKGYTEAEIEEARMNERAGCAPASKFVFGLRDGRGYVVGLTDGEAVWGRKGLYNVRKALASGQEATALVEVRRCARAIIEGDDSQIGYVGAKPDPTVVRAIGACVKGLLVVVGESPTRTEAAQYFRATNSGVGLEYADETLKLKSPIYGLVLSLEEPVDRMLTAIDVAEAMWSSGTLSTDTADNIACVAGVRTKCLLAALGRRAGIKTEIRAMGAGIVQFPEKFSPEAVGEVRLNEKERELRDAVMLILGGGTCGQEVGDEIVRLGEIPEDEKRIDRELRWRKAECAVEKAERGTAEYAKGISAMIALIKEDAE